MPLSTYTKTNWVNGGTPAINSTNLNKIETQLFDLTEDILTPSESSTTTATQSIISLPSTVMSGKLNVTLKGNTDVNIITNGNFTSTTGWVASSSTITANSNILSITGTGGANGPEAIQNTSYPVIIGNKFYIQAKVRVTNSVCASIVSQIDGSTGGTNVTIQTISSPVQNQWYLISAIGTTGASFTGNMKFNFYHAYIDSATANGKVMEVKEVMAIDLTSQYGAGNEPTATECALRYNEWFDGVKSTEKTLIKSIGKNLIDIARNYNDNSVVPLSGTASNIYLGDGKISATNATSGRGAGTKLKLKPNTEYTFQFKGIKATDSVTPRVYVYNSFNTTAIFNINATSDNVLYSNTFTTPYDGIIFIRYFRASSSTSTIPVYFYDIQIEQGSSATTYESYTETSAYFIDNLKKVSSTIQDTFNANTGLYIKNVSDFVTLSGNAYTWTLSSDITGGKLVYISASSLNPFVQYTEYVLKYNLSKLTSTTSIGTNDLDYSLLRTSDNRLYLSVKDTDTGWDEAWSGATSFTGMTFANLIKAYMNGWKLTTANTNVASCVWTGISSGTTKSGASGYTDVTTTIDTGFTPYRMLYQLATPVITQYYPNVLNAYPSGSINVYPAINDYDFYNNGAFISNTTYLINSLEYVNKVDKVTGKLTPIDLATCTVNANKLSFTSTALSGGDLVDYGYIYSNLSVLPTLTYSYQTDIKSQVNSNGEQIEILNSEIVQIDKKLISTTETLQNRLNDLDALALGGLI